MDKYYKNSEILQRFVNIVVLFIYRYFNKPKPSQEIIQDNIDRLKRTVLESLRGKGVLQTATLEFRHDVFRFLFRNKCPNATNKSWTLYNSEDFSAPFWPSSWDSFYNQHGEGYRIAYPVKMRILLGMTPKRYELSDDKMIEIP